MATLFTGTAGYVHPPLHVEGMHECGYGRMTEAMIARRERAKAAQRWHRNENEPVIHSDAGRR